MEGHCIVETIQSPGSLLFESSVWKDMLSLAVLFTWSIIRKGKVDILTIKAANSLFWDVALPFDRFGNFTKQTIQHSQGLLLQNSTFLFFTQPFLSLFICTVPCNTINAFKEKCIKVCTVIHNCHSEQTNTFAFRRVQMTYLLMHLLIFNQKLSQLWSGQNLEKVAHDFSCWWLLPSFFILFGMVTKITFFSKITWICMSNITLMQIKLFKWPLSSLLTSLRDSQLTNRATITFWGSNPSGWSKQQSQP